MSPFDFVCAFYSVVTGVAVAQLMTSVGRLLEVRARLAGRAQSEIKTRAEKPFPVPL